MPMVQEIDYGTRKIVADQTVTLTIDGPRRDGARRHLHHARLDGSRCQGSAPLRHRPR